MWVDDFTSVSYFNTNERPTVIGRFWESLGRLGLKVAGRCFFFLTEMSIGVFARKGSSQDDP